MLRASSLLCGRAAAQHSHRPHHRQIQQLVAPTFQRQNGEVAIGSSNNIHGSNRRLLSFKRFANRKDGKSGNGSNDRASVNRTEKANANHDRRNTPQHPRTSSRPTNNNAAQQPKDPSWRSRNPPGSSSTYNPPKTEFVPPSRISGQVSSTGPQSRPPTTLSNSAPPPWRQQHQQGQQQRREVPKPPSYKSSYRNNNEQSSRNIGRQQTPPTRATAASGEDLRDISHLRNTFMKRPDNSSNQQQQQQHSWRSGARAAAAGSNNTDLASSTATTTANTTPLEVDEVAASAGVGAKWTPSMYKKKTPKPRPPSRTPPQSPGPGVGAGISAGGTSATAATNEVRSIEQVMKENALQRKQHMEQTYINAGQRVPYNVDTFGNRGGGGGAPQKGNFDWRNRNNLNSDHRGGGRFDSRGGRGGQQYGRGGQPWQRNNNNNQRQSFQERNQKRQAQQRKQIRKYLPPSTPKEVRLPTTPQTLVDLSLLLRVRKRTIVRTLRSLGEQIAYTSANQDSYKIDVDTMEYICVELGIDPLKVEKKESDLEEAERRAMRLSSTRGGEGGKEEVDEGKKTEEEEKYAALPPRSPVVSIMGHVDHGKTTLMDALRRRAVTGENTPKGAGKVKQQKKKKKSKGGSGEVNVKGGGKRGKGGVSVDDGDVAGTEAGGITQVITAFEVPLPLEDGATDDTDDNQISTVTFLDTPGHAAFKKMRQSGSSATDVIVLVVAADDGVSPQTIEILDMFKSIARSQPQSISLVVAVSKIDKPGIDVDEAVMRIENQLIEQEIFTENVLAGGGDEGEFGAVQLFPVSGITGEGLDDLVEGLALQSEIMDLRADEEAEGQGVVIDARMEKGLGVVADCVIRWGSVRKGDFVVSGTNGGRVKFLNDVGNKPLTKARPSQPVRIVGFKSLPKAGDPIVCAKSEEDAKELIRLRESELVNEERAGYENDVELQVMGTAAKQGMMMQKAQKRYGYENGAEGGFGEDGEMNDSIYIPVVIKADSHGSLEAVRDALVSIGTDSKLDIVIDPVEMSTGVVTSSDVLMARESDAAIFVFGRVGVADKETKKQAEGDGVSIRSHDIIYRLLEDAKDFFGKYLPVEYVEKVHGRGNVQAVFEVTDSSKNTVSIAGLRVADGNLFKAKSKPGPDGEEPLPCFYRVLRKNKLLSPDVEKLEAASLRKVKEDVDSVRKGEECGLGLVGFNDLEEGDVVECFSIEEKRAAI